MNQISNFATHSTGEKRQTRKAMAEPIMERFPEWAQAAVESVVISGETPTGEWRALEPARAEDMAANMEQLFQSVVDSDNQEGDENPDAGVIDNETDFFGFTHTEFSSNQGVSEGFSVFVDNDAVAYGKNSESNSTFVITTKTNMFDGAILLDKTNPGASRTSFTEEQLAEIGI